MKCLIFVAIFACFLKVSLTWSISDTSEISPRGSSLQNQVTPGVVSSAAADQICYHQYDIRINTVVSKIKNGTDACNGMNDEIRFKINEQVKEIQGLTTKCNLELDPKKYIECMKSSAAKQILDQISLNADKYLKHYKTCPIDVLERGKYRSSSALYDLKLCLQKNHPSTLPIILPKPSTDDSSKNNVKYLETLNKYRMVCATLKKCVLDGSEFEECFEQAKNDDNLDNIHWFISEGGAFNYEKIAEIDKAENSCIRQFITTLSPFYSLKFDLKDCLMRGYNATIQFEEDEEKDIELIRKLKKLNNSYNSCRLITKDLDTQQCIQKLATISLDQEVKSEISMKSEDYYEKLSEIIEELYAQDFPCIGLLVKMSQSFSDLRFNKTERFNYFSCELQGHKSPLFIPKDNILDKLKEITDYIKSCTLHTDSPGFDNCLYNSVGIYKFDLMLADNLGLEFKELFEESDKNHNTCFGILVAEYERLMYNVLRELKKPRKPEELKLLTELEKCIMNNVVYNRYRKDL